MYQKTQSRPRSSAIRPQAFGIQTSFIPLKGCPRQNPTMKLAKRRGKISINSFKLRQRKKKNKKMSCIVQAPKPARYLGFETLPIPPFFFYCWNPFSPKAEHSGCSVRVPNPSCLSFHRVRATTTFYSFPPRSMSVCSNGAAVLSMSVTT